MSINIIEFEKAIGAADVVAVDIEAKVEAYKKSLFDKVTNVKNERDIQVQKIMEFLSSLKLGDSTGSYIDADNLPNDITIDSDRIILIWDADFCGMGPIPGTSVTIYHKAFSIPIDELHKELELNDDYLPKILEVSSIDEY